MTPPPATVAARRASTAAARAAAQSVSASGETPAGPAGLHTPRPRPAARIRTPERTTRRGITPAGPAPRRPRRVSGPASRASRPSASIPTAVPATPTPARATPTTVRATSAPSRAVPTPARTTRAPARTTRASARRTQPQAGTRSALAAHRPRVVTRLHVTAGLGAVGLALPGRLVHLSIAPRPRARVEGLLDRIVRGRAWIPVLAVMLVGIVAMQVEVLKLGASVGRSMNTATELAGQIQQERERVSALESPSRIERLATGLGLTQPGPLDDHFISVHTNIARALANISAPNPTAFAARLASERALDAAPSPGAQVPSPAAAGTPAPAAATATATPTAPTVSPAATAPTVSPAATAATATPAATAPTASPAATAATAAPTH